MKLIKLFILILLLSFPSFSTENYGEVQYEKGFYYVVIKNAKFDAVNGVLQNQIKEHRWGIIHTMNVDKTINSPIPHKTYLLCRADYLDKGIKFNKDIVSVIIPCRISIYQEKNDIKILVEDVGAYNSIFAIEDPKFKGFLNQVSEEMKSILQKTADNFSKKQNFPGM